MKQGNKQANMVELIPKKREIQLPHWLDVLFYVAIGIFIFSILGWFIITRIEDAAQKDLQVAKEKISREHSPERQAMKAEVLLYKKKIEDFAALLDTHYQTSKFLQHLEGRVHPKVWFSEIALDVEKFTVKLVGNADSFQTVGQQIMIFEGDKLLKNVNLSSLSSGKEGIQFSLDFSFDKAIFEQ